MISYISLKDKYHMVAVKQLLRHLNGKVDKTTCLIAGPWYQLRAYDDKSWGAGKGRRRLDYRIMYEVSIAYTTGYLQESTPLSFSKAEYVAI